MSDIVERLRRWAEIQRTPGFPKEQMLTWEAADEIERLRKAREASAEGMPDFGPGDRVQLRHQTRIGPRTVRAIFREHAWMVLMTDGQIWSAHAWEKVPTEKTVTLRYAGPPDVIDKFLAAARPVPDGVRVERVEDDE